MAKVDLQNFKNKADTFLQAEINKREDAKVSVGNVSFSSKIVAGSAISALLDKGARGASKSISQHMSDFSSQTGNLLNAVSGQTRDSLQNIISVFDGSSKNKIANSVDGAFRTILTGMSGSPDAVFSMAKNASSENSKFAKIRLDTSSQIISIINQIKSVRSNIQVPFHRVLPLDAAKMAEGHLEYAQDLLQIVISGFEASKDSETTAKVIRREASYNKSIEAMSDALDDLKIGAGQFKLSEYMRLRLDFKVLIEKFKNANFEIVSTKDNFIKSKEQFESNKNKIGAIEGNYVKEVFNKLSSLINQMSIIIKKNNDNIALRYFEDWSRTLLSIYTLAHNAFDRDIENSLSLNSDLNQKFDSAKYSYETIGNSIDAEEIHGKMVYLSDLYYVILTNSGYSESDVASLEKEITDSLSNLSQIDQQLISIDKTYTPKATEILGVLLGLTKGTGLDKISKAIEKGSVEGLFGQLNEKLGSTAAGASDSLKLGISDIPNLHLRETMLKVNAKIQSIQRNKQIAGSVRENLTNDAVRAINEDIGDLQSLRGQLQGLGV